MIGVSRIIFVAPVIRASLGTSMNKYEYFIVSMDKYDWWYQSHLHNSSGSDSWDLLHSTFLTHCCLIKTSFSYQLLRKVMYRKPGLIKRQLKYVTKIDICQWFINHQGFIIYWHYVSFLAWNLRWKWLTHQITFLWSCLFTDRSLNYPSIQRIVYPHDQTLQTTTFCQYWFISLSLKKMAAILQMLFLTHFLQCK